MKSFISDWTEKSAGLKEFSVIESCREKLSYTGVFAPLMLDE